MSVDINKEIEGRLRKILGSEEESIDKVRQYIERGSERAGADQPSENDGGINSSSCSAVPFKNVIPSKLKAPCAKNLEVWLFDESFAYDDKYNDMGRMRMARSDPWNAMDARLQRAYDLVVNDCRGITDLVVIRGNYWNYSLWQHKWGPRFQNIKTQAHTKRTNGSGNSEWDVLSNLVMVQKYYGRMYQPSYLIS